MMRKKLTLLLVFILAIPFTLQNQRVYSQSGASNTVTNSVYTNVYSKAAVTGAVYDSKTYYLIPSHWGIYTDGTRAAGTTIGFNRALQWAKSKGITTFVVPAGTYTIQKGNPINSYTTDPNARINLVENMTFVLDDNAVIKKEPNGYKDYDLLYVGPDAHNVTIKGGTYRGDKDAHDYSSGGTHERGFGIHVAGANHLTIDGVKVENFTGDGLYIGGFGKQIGVLYESDFESGVVDDYGKLVANPAKIRTKNIKTNFKDPIFKTQRAIHFSLPKNMSKKIPYSLYFYRSDGSLLSSLKNQEIDWSIIDIPDGADYFHAVFDTASYDDIKLEYWARFVTKNSVVKNSEFAFNRRQGITVAGVDNVLITNNKVHDTKGTAPQGGIDVEGGIGANGNRNTNVTIRGNQIYNNAAYNVVLYDGQDALVEDNYLGPNSTKTSVGLAISNVFRTGAVVKNNIFDGAKLAVDNESSFIGNTMNDSVASLVGPGVTLDGMTFTDSLLLINPNEPFGVTASNISMYNNKKSASGLTINNYPVHFSNISITGESLLRSITGNAADGSIFDNLKITGYSNFGLDLPRGTYNNCVFEAAAGGAGEAFANKSGKYVFNGCSFTSKGRGLYVNNKEQDLTVLNSKFDILGNTEAIHVEAAKKALIENNTINANYLTTLWRGIIKINKYGAAASSPANLEATIKGNTITSNIAAKGISTIDAGSLSPQFRIENNVLFNAKLQLRATDFNIRNVEK